MVFSWTNAKKNAIDTKVRRAKTMATVGQNSDFKLQHPDWVRDAQQKNFTALVKKVTEQTKKKQDEHAARRLKLVGKD